MCTTTTTTKILNVNTTFKSSLLIAGLRLNWSAWTERGVRRRQSRATSVGQIQKLAETPLKFVQHNSFTIHHHQLNLNFTQTRWVVGSELLAPRDNLNPPSQNENYRNLTQWIQHKQRNHFQQTQQRRSQRRRAAYTLARCVRTRFPRRTLFKYTSVRTRGNDRSSVRTVRKVLHRTGT